MSGPAWHPIELLPKKAWYIAYRCKMNTKSKKYDEETFEYPLHKRHNIIIYFLGNIFNIEILL